MLSQLPDREPTYQDYFHELEQEALNAYLMLKPEEQNKLLNEKPIESDLGDYLIATLIEKK